MLYRLILPKWLEERDPSLRRVIEQDLTDEQLLEWNEKGYNCYFWPNYPSELPKDRYVDATDIDTWNMVFVDLDMKDYKSEDPKRSHNYKTKDEFIAKLNVLPFPPSSIVDSGGGIHAYWQVTDLDTMSFLRLQRRLAKFLKSDPEVSKICQIMRVPGTQNTKKEDNWTMAEVVDSADRSYTCEQLDKLLPPITHEDETYCKTHYDRMLHINDYAGQIKDELPAKFMKLLKNSREAKELYAGEVDDRSKADWRLAHIMFAEGFTKEEAMSVLVNCRKALDRAPVHRFNYAANIADKVWSYEEDPSGDENLSTSVKDILRRSQANTATRFPCWEVFDGTVAGFRLTEVLGLIGGAGSGKTTQALNYFYWFTKLNPEYIHLFVSLEQPEKEIAARWARMTVGQDHLHDRVHVLGNYNSDGTYRHLSLGEIQEYVLKLEKKLGQKIGCVVIDHIGILKKGNKDDRQSIQDICHQMKSFAVATNTFLVMQSQTSRAKAGIGDVELDKDAAYQAGEFEWYCDYVVTTWQPLKRIYDQEAKMACAAFKYCKIREKNIFEDKVLEDTVHILMYDVKTGILREMTEDEEKSFDFWNKKATTLRNKDKRREPTRITRTVGLAKAAKQKESA